jgi:hypothetical protein
MTTKSRGPTEQVRAALLVNCLIGSRLHQAKESQFGRTHGRGRGKNSLSDSTGFSTVGQFELNRNLGVRNHKARRLNNVR